MIQSRRKNFGSEKEVERAQLGKEKVGAGKEGCTMGNGMGRQRRPRKEVQGLSLIHI